jgi:hypothetical protein
MMKSQTLVNEVVGVVEVIICAISKFSYLNFMNREASAAGAGMVFKAGCK